ncbi:MAG: NADH/ubiquinone/plastoquinone (complex I) [Sulfurovum sp.]|nr:MAG: NADH/ubiquinone/plastoquinone (complex I) [Sulfurovum sp.]
MVRIYYIKGIFTVNFDFNTLFLLAVPSFPLLLALTLMLKPLSKTVILLAPWMALPSLLVAMLMPIDICIEVPWLLLGSFVGLNETARVFLFFTSILWLMGGIYALGYFKTKDKKSTFFIWFLLAMGGNLGLIIAQDMVLFYTFFTLMSLASYGLVVHSKSIEALRAGRIYIILVIIGEIMLFAAFSMMIASAGSIEFTVIRATFSNIEVNHSMIALLLLGFGIKAGIVGVHVWLPLAHPVAPTPASAILSGAMIATGLLGLMQVLPLGEVELPFWGTFMMLIGMISTFYGVFVGLSQNNAKTVLAYSSISSMGIMITAIGLGLVSPELWAVMLMAILVYVLQHGFAKSALFLAVGIFAKPILSQVTRFVFILVLIISVLSLIGAPFTSSFVAKKMFDAQLSLSTSPWAEWVQVLLPLSSLAASLLLARFLYLIWSKNIKEYEKTKVEQDALVPKSMWISWLFLVVMAVLSPMIVWFLGIKTSPMVDLMSEKALISFSTTLGAVILLSCIAWYITKRYTIPERLKIPAGDLLIAVEKYILPSIIKSFAASVQTLQNTSQSLGSYINSAIDSGSGLASFYIGELDNKLKQWTVAIVLLLTIMFVFTLLAWRL